MNEIISLSLKDTLSSIKTHLTEKSVEWAGRAVVQFRLALSALKDPRMASLSLFIGNFLVLEIAGRIGSLVVYAFKTEGQEQENFKFACIKHLITTGIVVASNVAIVRAMAIKLHPIVVSAIVMVSFVTKYEMEECLQSS